jgi:hypothetical protein
MRFIFWDPTNDGKTYEDVVHIKIESSHETLSALCKWSELQVDGEISGTKDYLVTADRERQEYFIPSVLSRFDMLDDECQDMIEMTIEA